MLFYKGKLKVLQYFGHVKHDLAVTDVIDKVMKVINHTELRDAKCYLLNLHLWLGT